MTGNGLLQICLYLVVLLILAKPLGGYMARIYEGHSRFNHWLWPVEQRLYRLCGIDQQAEMKWTEYATTLLLFNLLGAGFVYALQRIQFFLPFNPQQLPNIGVDTAFNTAASFVTNTNWQSYSGETSLSYLVQMLGLGAQNFLSAATGMAVLVALIRGFNRVNANTIGNFWVDLTRSILYILLPLSVLLASVLVSQGVVQTLLPYTAVPQAQSTRPLQPASLPQQELTANSNDQSNRPADAKAQQILALGPAASQIAIKQLGTNGGGFFNVNSAHPFENPTPVSNFLEMLAILLIPAALCHTFGVLVGDTRQGWAILAAMSIVFITFVFVTVSVEQAGNPNLVPLGVDQRASADQPGGNMEGKELRFGIVNSALWSVATTAASNGSVNAMLDSFTPLGGMAPMWLMQIGEVIFGGVGSGLYGMLVFALIAVFVAGLMIGRTPEYLGKKIEAFEMQMAAVVILIPPMLVLGGTALAVMLDIGKSAVANPGAHGFSEILYAFSSAGNNNGSAFAGLSANTPFYNIVLGIIMLITRYWLIIPVLAIAGSLANKKIIPSGPGTLPTHTPLFVILLITTVIVVGALTFIPALALGPIVEQLSFGQGGNG